MDLRQQALAALRRELVAQVGPADALDIYERVALAAAGEERVAGDALLVVDFHLWRELAACRPDLFGRRRLRAQSLEQLLLLYGTTNYSYYVYLLALAPAEAALVRAQRRLVRQWTGLDLRPGRHFVIDERCPVIGVHFDAFLDGGPLIANAYVSGLRSTTLIAARWLNQARAGYPDWLANCLVHEEIHAAVARAVAPEEPSSAIAEEVEEACVSIVALAGFFGPEEPAPAGRIASVADYTNNPQATHVVLGVIGAGDAARLASAASELAVAIVGCDEDEAVALLNERAQINRGRRGWCQRLGLRSSC